MKTKLLILLFLASFYTYAQTNLVPNGGFENWTNSTTLSNWTIENSITQNTSSYTEGSNSAKLSIANSTTKPKIIAQVPLTAGTTYTVKFKYKYLNSNYSGDHPISLNISQNGSATTLSSSTFATDNNWSVKETTFTPDQNLSYDLSISLYSFDAAAFNVLIDDVQVYIQGTEQYTLIPDVNFENKLIALGIDSSVADGKVLTNNVNKLTSLDVSSSSIADLTGIQDFVALTYLNCSSNQLSSLDVSKNTDLNNLSCYSNKLTSLDIYKNLNLKWLWCVFNQLTNLDVSKNLFLQSLFCYGNELTALDISKNLALQNLWCQSNQLTALDISKNTALTSLNCSINQLTSLDVSKNLGLNELECEGNQLITLDITKNVALSKLYCYSNNLTSLNLKNGKNTLLTNTNINLSSNPNLKCILVDDVVYSDTNWSNKKDAAASFNTDCTPYTMIPDNNFEDKLIALGIDIDGKNGKVVTQSIATLTSLNISHSSIADLTGIQDFVALTSLNCATNKLISLDVTKNVALTSLICNSNQLTTLNVTKNVALINFYCHNNKITDLDISQNINLKGLMCHFNELTTIDISKNTKLELLDCLNNKITSLDVSKNPLITELACENNQLIYLNLKNGANTILDLTYSNFVNNPNLKCIQVDDIVYSDANWTSKKDISATFNLDCTIYTLIPDAKFEDKLIALGIDKDGKNGKVATESIASLTSLDISSSSIADLTGIQDFKAMTYLTCNDNALTTLDVSKNVTLNYFECSNNQLTTLDVSKNVALTIFSCRFNKLLSLNLKNGKNTLLTNANIYLNNNPNLKCILVDDINYADTNWSSKKDTTATFNTDCTPYTLIPDSNFEDKLIALGIDIDGKNGKVKTESVASLTSLEVYSSNIASLTGIEDFVSLNYLDCSDNALTVLNVTKNAALTDLYCNANKLTSIDVSKNLVLNKLNASENVLTSLDVSKNTSLTEINCYTNNLTSLNLKNGNNVNMKRMYFANLAQNPNLICIQVDNATFCNSNWEAKDATAGYSSDCIALSNTYTTIPDAKFEEKLIALGIDKDGKNGKVLSASIYNVGTLDVSNSGITDLTGIHDFRMITSLTCGNNALTALDVSKNQSLDKLYCSVNKIANLDLTQNTALTVLSSSFNLLTTLDVSVNKSLKQLECSNNSLTYLNIQNGNNTNMQSMMFGNFTENPKLTCILVDDAAYSMANWDMAIDKITTYSSTPCITYTLIPDSYFEEKLIALEIDKDGKNGKIQTASINQVIFLDVADSNISDLTGLQDFTALIYFFCDRNNITTIDLSKNLMLENIGVLDNNLTSIDISKNTKIHTLELSKNQITSVDLSQNINLKRLGFENNKITEIDLTNNKELWFVSGYGNLLTNLDLSQNKKIEVINVDNNQLTAINVQNGNNKNFVLPPVTSKTTATNLYCSFINNSKLECIKVDDEAYSNAHWANIKDATATYSSTCSALGIEDSVFDKIAIYPIPTKKELHIDNIMLEKVTVYDALGKLVKTTTFTSGANNNTLHLEGFASGLYYIYLESEGAHTAKKIIVE
ncbi:T9SS type A sorting domain-containing protein [Flavobacterium sp. N3904]|uniref:T9SS type A sorting domain-containing protein n=1 Tax=Flavobacterium sp. N3904 TaxID=2986835 RepID=UPI0022256DC5|nr:T9SS type A sorting domain-containing protein [Flavobacterium sp. N3904]